MATKEIDAVDPFDDAEPQEPMFIATGRTEPAYGPSDSSDSYSDLPGIDTDTDRASTGERIDVEDSGSDLDSDDVRPDKIVTEDDAGLAHTPPSPERNGGIE